MNRENIMGAAPIPSLLLKMSLPVIISQAFNSFFFFADTIFISHLNEQALTALSLSAPLIGLTTAFGSGVSVGFNAAVSKALGEKDEARIRSTVSSALFLALCSYIILALIGIFVSRPYMVWQSGGDAAVIEHGVRYLRISLLLSFGQMVQWVVDRCLIAAGRTTLFLYSLVCASLINLTLDPILIFGLFGLPALGTAGSAIATFIGQTSAAIFCTWLNLRWNKAIPLNFSLRIHWDRVAEILRVGIPTALMQFAISISGILMNLVLTGFSTTAVAVYAICNRIQGMALISINGVTTSIIPIAAYNYGARRRDRVSQTLRWSNIEAMLFMAVTLMAIELFPGQILGLFDASENMLRLGVPAIRIISTGYFISVFCQVFSSFFQAFGKGNYSMILALIRQALLPLSFVLLFSRTGSLNLVWLAFPLAELLSIPCALPLYGRIRRDIISRI